MKILLKNNCFQATLLVLLGFLLHLLLLLTFTSYISTSSIKFLLILLYYFYLIPIFFLVIKYKFKDYAIPALAIFVISIFFLRLGVISVLINLYIPGLLFKLMFKDFSLKSFNKSYYSLILYSLIITILFVLILQTDQFSKMFENQITQMDKQWAESIQTLKKSNIPAKELIKLENAKNFLTYILKNYYAILIFYSIAISLTINYIFSIVAISKYIAKKPQFINIFYIKTPEYYIWLFLFSGILVILSFYTKNPLYKKISINLALIISFIYILEGGLIFLYKFLMIKINFIFKFIILFLLFRVSFMYLKYAVLFFGGIGILDYWFDFRKSSTLKNNSINKSA